MSEPDAEDDQNPSDDDGSGQDETTHRHRKANKLKLSTGHLTVEAESVNDSVSDLADVCSKEMESLMRYYIRGEMEMLEEDDLHSII
ncbi:hypothetical protein GCM10008995_03790 [Halobellus salinus]|uniref:Uncharacterized protein n=1 Tax=Halobellus salinus TaxID=931585 RepID=A0A830ECK3_9EURY|nr:hypothetical protein [Halobellus salinus]GGI97076.1 hypothetical protein GCM10008995_03790 [Halobellus salinus]SMP13708.1 hypothetical protein SAMN06265347_104226 [Halobellus salinus]